MYRHRVVHSNIYQQFRGITLEKWKGFFGSLFQPMSSEKYAEFVAAHELQDFL